MCFKHLSLYRTRWTSLIEFTTPNFQLPQHHGITSKPEWNSAPKCKWVCHYVHECGAPILVVSECLRWCGNATAGRPLLPLAGNCTACAAQVWACPKARCSKPIWQAQYLRTWKVDHWAKSCYNSRRRYNMVQPSKLKTSPRFLYKNQFACRSRFIVQSRLVCGPPHPSVRMTFDNPPDRCVKPMPLTAASNGCLVSSKGSPKQSLSRERNLRYFQQGVANNQ